MKLVFPNLELKEQYYDLVKSALRNDDISEMGNAYRENEKYEDMLIRLENRSKGINISSRDVPATVQFILNEKGKVVGTIDIRHDHKAFFCQNLRCLDRLLIVGQ